MEHKFSAAYRVSTDDIINLLSCEGGGFDYWCEICFDDETYAAAKARLESASKSGEIICYEEVLADILEHNGTLKVWDREDDKDHDLTLASLLNGWKIFVEAGGSIDMDDFDADVADCILQDAVFGEVIYG